MRHLVAEIPLLAVRLFSGGTGEGLGDPVFRQENLKRSWPALHPANAACLPACW